MNCIDPTQGNSNLISNQIYIYIKLLIHYFVHRMDHGDIKSEFVLKSSRLNYCQSSGVLWDQPTSIPERPGSCSQALVRQNQKAPIRESVNAVWLQHQCFSISSLFSEPDISSSKEEQRVTLMAFPRSRLALARRWSCAAVMRVENRSLHAQESLVLWQTEGCPFTYMFLGLFALGHLK